MISGDAILFFKSDQSSHGVAYVCMQDVYIQFKWEIKTKLSSGSTPEVVPWFSPITVRTSHLSSALFQASPRGLSVFPICSKKDTVNMAAHSPTIASALPRTCHRHVHAHAHTYGAGTVQGP